MKYSTTLKNAVLLSTAVVLSSNSLAQWSQKGNSIIMTQTIDASGTSVGLSADGNVFAIGAPGHDEMGNNTGEVRVFEWDGTNWLQKGTDLNGTDIGGQFGVHVDLSDDGNTLAVGAHWNDAAATDAGQVKIYSWNGSNWVQKGGNLNGDASADAFGYQLDLNSDGNTIIIGALDNDNTNGSDAGQVKVFEWNGTAWIQKGGDILGENPDDSAGSSVAINDAGDLIAVGSNENDDNGSNAGHVRIFEWNGTAWNQVGAAIEGETANERSGTSVALDALGNTVAIGANFNEENGPSTGQVQVFERDGSNQWIQKGTDLNGELDGQLGISVDLSDDGNTLVTGEYRYGPSTDPIIGRVTVYNFGTTDWMLKGSPIIGDGEGIDPNQGFYQFGRSVKISANGNIVGIGATGSMHGQERVYQFCESPDVTTTLNGLTITSNDSNGLYQWIDCDNNFAVIAGETNQSFTATSNGNYAVIITKQGCAVDTSNCVTIDNVGITENGFGNGFNIFPNPSNGNFTVQLGAYYDRASIRITNVQGQQVHSFTVSNKDVVNFELNQPNGVYFMHITSGEKVASVRLLKQ